MPHLIVAARTCSLCPGKTPLSCLRDKSLWETCLDCRKLRSPSRTFLRTSEVLSKCHDTTVRFYFKPWRRMALKRSLLMKRWHSRRHSTWSQSSAQARTSLSLINRKRKFLATTSRPITLSNQVQKSILLQHLWASSQQRREGKEFCDTWRRSDEGISTLKYSTSPESELQTTDQGLREDLSLRTKSPNSKQKTLRKWSRDTRLKDTLRSSESLGALESQLLSSSRTWSQWTETWQGL